MRRISVTGLLLLITSVLFAQNIDAIISVKEVERIERTLSADDMRGRRTFSPEIDKAADFIAAEFKAIGLQTWNNGGSFRQEAGQLAGIDRVLALDAPGQQLKAARAEFLAQAGEKPAGLGGQDLGVAGVHRAADLQAAHNRISTHGFRPD